MEKFYGVRLTVVIKEVNAATISWSVITAPSLNVQITFKLKNRFTWDSYNLIYVVICGTCMEEYSRETGQGKTKLRGRVRVYHQHIRQPQYQQLKVEGHLRVCGSGNFEYFLCYKCIYKIQIYCQAMTRGSSKNSKQN